MSRTDVHDLLVRLAGATTLRDRNAALPEYREMLAPRVKSHVAKSGRHHGDEAVEWMLDKLVDRAQAGGLAGYRGDRGQESALEYVGTAVRNAFIDRVRWKKRQERKHEAYERHRLRQRDAERERRARAAEQARLLALRDRIARLLEPLVAKEGPETAPRIRMGLARIVYGRDGDAHLRAWGYLPAEGPVTQAQRRRAQNLSAQHVRRGRFMARKLVARLVEDGRITEEEASTFMTVYLPLRNRAGRAEDDEDPA